MEENTRTIAYSQHYRSAQEFIGTPADQVVFQYIWDEWLCRYRQGKSTAFKLSINKLSQRRQINRRTIVTSLKRLEFKKLIEVDESGICTLNVERFISLASTYEHLNIEARIKFVEDLEVGNPATCESYNCAETEDAYELINELEGGLCKITQDCAKMHNSDDDEVVQNYTDLCKNAQPCVKMHNPEEGKVVQKCTTLCKNAQLLLDEYISLLKDNFSPEELCNEIYQYFEGVETWESLLERIVGMFSGSELCKNAQLDMILLFATQSCVKMHKGLCKNAQLDPKSCVKMHNSKRNIINKENKVASQWEMENEMEDELDENFPDDSEKEEEVDSQVGEINLAAFDALNSRYEKIRKRRRLPFIPVREVEEAIKNLPAFLDRPEMIFINQLWEILSELFVGETLNDQDEWVEVKLDPEGMTIPTNRLMQDLLIPAYEATKQILDSGKYFYKGDELPVSSDKKFEPEDLELLIDWQLSSDKEGRHYVISKSRFKNIYSQEVEEKNRRLSVREGREQDKDYMRQIIKLGDNEEDYDKLTDIELVAYNFLVENFDISEDFQTFSPKFPYINHLGLTRFYHTFRGSTVTPQDFLGILYKNAPDRNDGSLILKPRTFSAQAIIEWNQKHTQISAIVPLDE